MFNQKKLQLKKIIIFNITQDQICVFHNSIYDQVASHLRHPWLHDYVVNKNMSYFKFSFTTMVMKDMFFMIMTFATTTMKTWLVGIS
jgi:hypothetical protein